MSIHSIDGSKGNAALQWLESSGSTNKTGTTGASNSDNSVTKPNRTADFSQLVVSFGNLLKEYKSDFGGAKGAALTDGTSASDATGSAAEHLLGTRSVALSGSNAAADNTASANQTLTSPSVTGRSAVGAGREVLMASSPTTPAQSSPQASVAAPGTAASDYPSLSTGEAIPGISEVNPTQMCTLAQAQSVQAAFPNATLEVWTDSGPVPASSLTGVGADQQLPYVIAYGTNSNTGGPNLYYAGVIVNEGQQAMTQIGYGQMTAGDYYVWNTPNAQGVSGVTDAGSSFTQFAQYYATQLMAGNPVNPMVYTPNV